MEKEYRINWLIVVLGSFILLTFIIVPPVLRLIDNKASEVEKNGNDVKPNEVGPKTYTCTYKYDGEYNVTDVVSLYYTGNDINIYARTKYVTYKGFVELDLSNYENKKAELALINGVYYNYVIGENTVKEEFRVNYDGTQSLNEVFTNFETSSDINDMVRILQDQNYVCE